MQTTMPKVNTAHRTLTNFHLITVPNRYFHDNTFKRNIRHFLIGKMFNSKLTSEDLELQFYYCRSIRFAVIKFRNCN